MAIEKYVTKCIVIESYDYGEHDRVYVLFTREFGVVRAYAKSVRKLESKLRPHILPRTVSLVTLVQGREFWRLVGAEQIENTAPGIHEVTHLIKRFMKGEGAHKTLYDRVIDFLDNLSHYDEQKSRLLLYYILLVELGYADAKVIGAKDLQEYINWTVDDMYMHLLLSYEPVRNHVHAVLKEIQL
jgi:DNA repair protein RecO